MTTTFLPNLDPTVVIEEQTYFINNQLFPAFSLLSINSIVRLDLRTIVNYMVTYQFLKMSDKS